MFKIYLMATIALIAIPKHNVLAALSFGAEMKSMFLINKDATLLNHGSRGAVAKPVFYRRRQLMLQFEEFPDVWFASTEHELYKEAVVAAAKFVGTQKENLVIVDNVSFGICTAFDAIDFKVGDKILITDHTYSGVRAHAERTSKKKGTEILKFKYPLPLTGPNDLIEAYRKVLDNNTNIKVAVIDHVSMRGIVEPVKELTKLIHEYGVIVIIDGAHAPGQIPLDIDSIGADFYAGNFYKWAYASHTSAFLYIAPRFVNETTPLVTSYYYSDKKSDNARLFSYLGTRDTTNFLSLPMAFKFIRRLGGVQTITDYTSSLLMTAREDLLKAWNTTIYPIPDSMKAPSMMMLLIPLKYYEGSSELGKLFFKNYNVQVNFFTGSSPGEMWVRIMANVYNTLDDYVRLRDAMLDFAERQKEFNKNDNN